MLAKVLTGAVVGLDGAQAEVEVDIAPGRLPAFLIVGLPDVAIRYSGLAFPMRRTTVNLPAGDGRAPTSPGAR